MVSRLIVSGLMMWEIDDNCVVDLHAKEEAPELMTQQRNLEEDKIVKQKKDANALATVGGSADRSGLLGA